MTSQHPIKSYQIPVSLWVEEKTEMTKGISVLQMHVNHRRVGTVYKGMASTRKSPLNPSELMIGCHKDSDNQLYRGYNDAEFDELALWKRSLLDNETMFFLGGYGMLTFLVHNLRGFL